MTREHSWRWLLVALPALLSLVVFAGCGDDDDDDDSEADKPDVDLIALVVSAYDETPRRLPDDLKLEETYFGGKWSGSVGTVDFTFSNATQEGHGFAVVFRTEAEARAEVLETAEFEEATESKKERGTYCEWTDVPYYLDVDIESASMCFGHAGTVYIEAELGEVSSQDSEAALPLLQALERHFDGLAEKATHRVRSIKPEPLASLLADLPPPGPGSMEFAESPVLTWPDEGDASGMVLQIKWSGSEDLQEGGYFMVFESAADAKRYREENNASVKNAGELFCAIPSDTTFRYCGYQMDEVMMVVQRTSSTTAPATDPVLKAWADKLVEHLTTVRSGRLPRAPKATPTPNPKTPTVKPTTARTPTVARTSTATPTPPPQVFFFNSGTWTFDMVVTSNSCAGGQPAVGSGFTLQYTFEDLTGDGFLFAGEVFNVRQTLPGSANVGYVQAALPSTTLAAEVRSGTVTGQGQAKVTFLAPDTADVEYRESYASCAITGKTT